MNHSLVKIITLFGMTIAALPYLGLAEQGNMDIAKNHLYIIEPGPIEKSTLYADGSVIELQTESVTWPIIGSDVTNLTLGEFRKMVQAGRQAFENDPNKIIVSGDGSRGGLNIVFNVTNPPPGAVAALESAATYIENLFTDSVTVTISIGFSSMGPTVLGWCQSYYAGSPTWTETRNGLINDMDADDSIQNWLPLGSTIPVRYTYNNPTITNEDRCYFTKANYNAAIGTVSGDAAHIEFNIDFTWDYDPSNGITGGYMCFQSVATHETGHCLGFTSGADFRPTDIEALDIYRFQLSDGSGDFNPDYLSEFQATARMSDLDNGTSSDDVNSDLITYEYRMSDGDPYQCSHFSQNNVNAIMQPAMSSSKTFYPYFYRIADRHMFDAIGWDYLTNFTMDMIIVGNGTVNKDPDSFAYQPGTQVELLATPDPGWAFDHWSGDLTGGNNPDTVTMDYDKTITANFRDLYYTLTTNVIGSGSVLKNPDLPEYLPATPVELTADPDPGWSFDHWSGNLWGSQNPDTIIMNGNRTVTAHFEDQYVAENQLSEIQSPFIDISPNPSRDRVIIEYGIGQNKEVTSGHELAVSINIYDVAGNTVKSFNLASDILPHASKVSWDGRDNVGKKVSSGVYFIKFEAGDYKETRKLLLLR